MDKSNEFLSYCKVFQYFANLFKTNEVLLNDLFDELVLNMNNSDL